MIMKKKVDLTQKHIVLNNPDVLLNAISERINALAEINEKYPRYTGSLYSACKEVEDDIERLVNEIDGGINMMQDPDVWALFDDESQHALEGWIETTREALDANREEVEKARKFLAQYGQ